VSVQQHGKLVKGERKPNMELHAIERSRTEQTDITGECTAAGVAGGRNSPELTVITGE
jgi:hypothetical protein